MLRKILIANRGEIAVRLLRAAREAGLGSVAVFSDADRGALHLRHADEAVHIGPAAPTESYLNLERLIAAARKSGADAVAPGYGFASENPELAEACERAGLVFIGPPAQAMRQMASKTAARALMAKEGVPIVPGGQAKNKDEAVATAEQLGYPLLLKASAGGGGKGMRRIESAADLEHQVERAQSEAERAFGDPTVYLERALDGARHIEIQLLGDQQGSIVHLFERDCSIQRRHQKIVEETPSPVVDATLLKAMGAAAVRAAQAVGYYSAGTVEFLWVPSGEFYFLEMNTRLQVEHPITELVTGVDLVQEMFRIAQGQPLSESVTSATRRGHAIECRIYAEDPEHGFMPSPGVLGRWREPSGPGVRVDSGVAAGSRIGTDYDPLLAKVCSWGNDRASALARMRRALCELRAAGVKTNVSLLLTLLDDQMFMQGQYDTQYVERHLPDLNVPRRLASSKAEALAAALAIRAHERVSPAIEAAEESASGRREFSAWRGG